MSEVPIKNSGRETLYVGGYMIPPGETRILPASIVPAHFKPGAAAPVQSSPAPTMEDVVANILRHSVKEISEMLPSLQTEDIDALETTESASEKPRKSLLTAFSEERLRRAAETDLEEFRAQVRTMNQDELLTHIDLVEDDPRKLEIIKEQLDVLAETQGAAGEDQPGPE